MTSDPIVFSPADASAPPGPGVISPKEIEAMGVIGIDIGQTGRVTLMNQIGMALGVPRGGWHGQAKLFEHDDVRLRWLLKKFADQHQAKLMADNLARAARYVDVNLVLTLVSAAREFDRSLTAQGTVGVETYHQGGLDFLWENRKRLGLPGAVLRTWKEVPRFENRESGSLVHPAKIPAHDQLMAYAAQIASSFTVNFRKNLKQGFGERAETALNSASRPATLVWQAYSFLAPGGNPYNPHKKLRDQLNQHFGHGSAIGYYAHKAREQKRTSSLDDIVTDHSLDQLEWFRSAKTRAAETLFLEQLLKRARALLPH